MKWIAGVWNRIPPTMQAWLKGAEAAVISAVAAAFFGAPFADFTTKAGIAKFGAGVAAVAYGALRLYMTQSPLTAVLRDPPVSK